MLPEVCKLTFEVFHLCLQLILLALDCLKPLFGLFHFRLHGYYEHITCSYLRLCLSPHLFDFTQSTLLSLFEASNYLIDPLHAVDHGLLPPLSHVSLNSPLDLLPRFHLAPA